MNDYGPMRCDLTEEREADLAFVQLCAEFPGAEVPMEAKIRLSLIMVALGLPMPAPSMKFSDLLRQIYKALS